MRARLINRLVKMDLWLANRSAYSLQTCGRAPARTRAL